MDMKTYREAPRALKQEWSAKRLSVPKSIKKGQVSHDGSMNYLENKQLLSLQKMFQDIDSSRDGLISLSEMKKSRHFNIILSQEEIEQIQKDQDDDQSGSINWVEFVQMMCPCGYLVNDELVTKVPSMQKVLKGTFFTPLMETLSLDVLYKQKMNFNHADLNHDGILSAAELKVAL